MRVNERIRVKDVRLIDEQGLQAGVVPMYDALKRAKEKGFDLVEVAPQTNPPVCRIMDYSKYKYDQEKKEREAKKRQRQTHLKEIKIKPNIEEHDYQVKLAYLKKFLSRRDKTKITLMFRGREMSHIDIGRRVLDRMATDLNDIGVLEKPPTREGRFMTMVIGPK